MTWLARFSWIPVLAIIAGLVMSLIWAADRSAPFVVKSSRVIPPVVAGETAKIEGEVWRDISRSCDLEVRHWIEDSAGFRHYLPNVQMASESIRRLEQISPGITRYTMAVPVAFAPGKAIYHAESLYTCNPVHMIWPISVITRISFDVLTR